MLGGFRGKLAAGGPIRFGIFFQDDVHLLRGRSYLTKGFGYTLDQFLLLFSSPPLPHLNNNYWHSTL